jgi:hypothetical protein
MSNRNYVYVQTRPSFSFTSVSTAQTKVISMQGFDTLILDVDFTRAAGTATVFTFTGKSVNTSNDYGLTVTDYSSRTIADASFTYTSSSTYSKRFIFSLTGLGVFPDSAGNITLGIAVTSGTTDAITCTPTVALTG